MSSYKNSTTPKSLANDTYFMQRAIDLAALGKGAVNPNPLVGAVIVKDNKIIGEGYHQVFGGPHAEVNAFNQANADVEGATMYVTLEPCSHHGKTPPCALKIIEKGIKKVVISQLDPNPLVYKKGVKLLEDAGIEVTYGILEEKTKQQNEIFLKYIQTKKPFVSVKYAMSLDGKIQTKNKDSKWITNASSRAYVQDLRLAHMAILVGVNTVIVDNPKLNIRDKEVKKQPVRIIIDPNLRTPKESYVVQTAKTQRTIIVTTKNYQSFIDLGVELMVMPKIDLNQLLSNLGEQQIDSVLVEGGSQTIGTFIDLDLVDKLYAFIAPKIVGGDGLSPVRGQGIEHMNLARILKRTKVEHFDGDILITGYLKEEQ